MFAALTVTNKTMQRLVLIATFCAMAVFVPKASQAQRPNPAVPVMYEEYVKVELYNGQQCIHGHMDGYWTTGYPGNAHPTLNTGLSISGTNLNFGHQYPLSPGVNTFIVDDIYVPLSMIPPGVHTASYNGAGELNNYGSGGSGDWSLWNSSFTFTILGNGGGN